MISKNLVQVKYTQNSYSLLSWLYHTGMISIKLPNYLVVWHLHVVFRIDQNVKNMQGDYISKR